MCDKCGGKLKEKKNSLVVLHDKVDYMECVKCSRGMVKSKMPRKQVMMHFLVRVGIILVIACLFLVHSVSDILDPSRYSDYYKDNQIGSIISIVIALVGLFFVVEGSQSLVDTDWMLDESET